jgi:hypothetical protein
MKRTETEDKGKQQAFPETTERTKDLTRGRVKDCGQSLLGPSFFINRSCTSNTTVPILVSKLRKSQERWTKEWRKKQKMVRGTTQHQPEERGYNKNKKERI